MTAPRYWRRCLPSEVLSRNSYYDLSCAQIGDMSLNWTDFMRVDVMVRGSYTPAALFVVRALL